MPENPAANNVDKTTGLSRLVNSVLQRCGSILVIALMALMVWGVWLVVAGGLSMPVPDGYSEDMGLVYATELAENGQRLSFILLVTGWLCVCLAGLFAMTAALVGPTSDFTAGANLFKALGSQRGLLCSAMAIILAGIGWQCLDRASAASQAASVATLSIATATYPGGDRVAYDACIQAKTAWLEGRMNHDRLQSITQSLGSLDREFEGQEQGQAADTHAEGKAKWTVTNVLEAWRDAARAAAESTEQPSEPPVTARSD